MWVLGRWVAIDKQMIGFQGASSMKLRISHKREGDGFQCDAICNRGYTYSLWFHHGPPPDLGPQFKDLELSPTAARVIWLAQRLPNKWTRVFMDNLYNSVKLFNGMYRVEALVHGVAWTNGRGLPPSIVQREEKSKIISPRSFGGRRRRRGWTTCWDALPCWQHRYMTPSRCIFYRQRRSRFSGL
jgi:hypothetical protein